MKPCYKTAFFLLLLLPAISSAQPLKLRLSPAVKSALDLCTVRSGSGIHTSITPLNTNDYISEKNYDSLLRANFSSLSQQNFFSSRHALDVSKSGVRLTLDPLVDLEGGTGNRGGFYTAAAGMYGDLRGKKWAAGGSFAYYHMKLPDFIEERALSDRVIPSGGYTRPAAGNAYAMWLHDFYASATVLKHFDLEAGFGKNFLGDGCRSMFISDYAYSYPYFRIKTTAGKIRYINLYASFRDMQHATSGKWSAMEKKYGAFHFLSWDVFKWLNIGVFEAVIWEAADSTGKRGFDVNYLNPIIFLRPVEFSRGSPDNALLGASLKIHLTKKTYLYGQLLIDDIVFGEVRSGLINRLKHVLHKTDSIGPYGYWANKQAWQAGFRALEPFGLKGVEVCAEWNAARPYTWSHRRVIQNYGHYNQPLAHPLGANFNEILGRASMLRKNWFFEARGSMAFTGLDTAGTHFGADIFKMTWDAATPYGNVPVQQYGNTAGQGVSAVYATAMLRVSRIINPRNNLRIEAGYFHRYFSFAGSKTHSGYFFAGIKTSLRESLPDFF